MKWLFLAFLLLTAVPTVCYADDSSHRQAVLQLLDVTKAHQMLDQVMGSVDTAIERQFEALELTPEGKEAAQASRQEMKAWLSESLSWEKIQEMYVDVYREVFTEQEVMELIEFYETPLGQKILEKMPQLVQAAMGKTRAMFQERMPELQKRLGSSLARLKEQYQREDVAGEQQESK